SGCKACLKGLVLMFRSCATETHEPCQVREEAAVSGHFCVPQGSLGCAMSWGTACGCCSNSVCTDYIMMSPCRMASGVILFVVRSNKRGGKHFIHPYHAFQFIIPLTTFPTPFANTMVHIHPPTQ